MQRAHAAVTDSGVRGGDVFDQVLGADKPSDSPPCGVEVLAGGADGEGEFGDLGGEGGYASERNVIEAVVYLDEV